MCRQLMSKVMLLFRKQCIESEKLFDFLKDLVDRATSTASKKDNRGVSAWPMYRYGACGRLKYRTHQGLQYTTLDLKSKFVSLFAGCYK